MDRLKLIRAAVCLAGLITAISSSSASELVQQDRRAYHLFHPTPRELLREMTTDRPDKTESPFTVDAGHAQIEMDLVTFGYDRFNTERTDTSAEALSIAPINLKLGLLHNMDLQLVLESYTSVRIHHHDSREVERHRGFGDVLIRNKLNLWGNDGGPTAFAVMPFVKLPANQDHLGNNSLEGGIILPLALELPHEWSLGLMTEIDVIRNSERRGHHPEFVNTVTIGHDIVGRLGGYAEFFSAVSPESDSAWVGTIDFGVTYGLTDDIQLDAGINIGITRSADDFNPFVGISFRF